MGWLSRTVFNALATQLALGYAGELVEQRELPAAAAGLCPKGVAVRLAPESGGGAGAVTGAEPAQS